MGWDKQANTQTDRHTNAMTRTGLRAGPSEKGLVKSIVLIKFPPAVFIKKSNPNNLAFFFHSNDELARDDEVFLLVLSFYTVNRAMHTYGITTVPTLQVKSYKLEDMARYAGFGLWSECCLCYFGPIIVHLWEQY